MTRDPQVELGESVPRFVTHWIAACFGHFLMLLLPLIAAWPHALANRQWPSWWAMLAFAGSTSLLAAVVNANLPVTARELIKSVALGLALNATVMAVRVV